MSKKVFKRTKDCCTFQDTTLVEEIWQKRTKKKNTYFDKSIPKNISLNFLHKSEGVKTISDKINHKQSLECKKHIQILKLRTSLISKKCIRTIYQQKIE